jgi:disulfide bond formation protein DsbB
MIAYLFITSIIFISVGLIATWYDTFNVIIKLTCYLLFFYGMILTAKEAGIVLVIENQPTTQCIKYQTGLFGKQCTQYETKN